MSSGKKIFLDSFSPRFVIMALLLVVCLICSNIFVQRMFGIWNFQFSGAVFLFPITYIINDCLTEVYGYRKAMFVVWISFILAVFIALCSLLLCLLPQPLDSESRELALHFDQIFNVVPRTTAASLIAFVVGSAVNSLTLSKMKLATSGKRFSIRAILSSIFGELTDSLVFFPIAFLGILNFNTIIVLMCSELVVKILFEISALPLINLIVKHIKKVENIDTFDNNISYNPFKIL